MTKTFDILFLVVATIIGIFLIATSIPLGSPHIYAYCLLSQLGTIPADSDAFRIFCLKGSTDSANGVEDTIDDRVQGLKDLDSLDRYVPYQRGAKRPERVTTQNE